MGVNTTIGVSRKKARLYLVQQAMTMGDGELENALDSALSERLYSVRIVSDDHGPDDDLLDYR